MKIREIRASERRPEVILQEAVMARIRTLTALAAIAFCASGCGSAGFQIREAIGVDKNPPDAFVILPTRELEIPQNLTALPPPSPGAASPLEIDPRAMALSALGGQPAAGRPVAQNTVVLGQPPANARFVAAPAPAVGALYAPAPSGYAPAPSGAESALLAAAGAQAVPADLRSVVASEAAAQPSYLLDRWFPGLARLRGEAAGEIVEPLTEMRRLGQDAPEAGAPLEGRVVSPLLIPPSASAAP